MGNLFSPLPTQLPEEVSQMLVNSASVRIERVVSHGHASPVGFWYDQDENEWVIVLKGRAKLQFQGDEKLLEMGPGDFVNIPAHQRHRVQWTTDQEPTIWLAVFYHHD